MTSYLKLYYDLIKNPSLCAISRLAASGKQSHNLGDNCETILPEVEHVVVSFRS